MIGYVDRIGMTAIVGWVEPRQGNTEPWWVQALFRGKVIGRAIANVPRPDVARVTHGNPNCGFVIEIDPPYDVDEIEVMVNGRALPRSQQVAGGDAPGTAEAPLPGFGRPLSVTTPKSTPFDIEICKRLIATYRDLFSKDDRTFAGPQSLWSTMLRSNYRNLTSIVTRGCAQELCNYLLHAHKRPETWGLSQGPESYHLLSNAHPESPVHRAHAEYYRKELLSLAEYLAILPVENSGQGYLHGSVDLATVVNAIRDRIGIEPIFPHTVGGLFCLDTGAGLVQQRDVWALYAALRAADLLPDLSRRRICEIGGGLGQLCHYARLLGVRQYVLIDLPHVSLLQAFMLLRAHPESRIALFNGGDFDQDVDICIYPTFMYQSAPVRYFDLTVNVDSMPEMGWDNALSYARAAARNSAGFLSINQEARGPLGIKGASQINASEVLALVPSFRQVYRFRSWVRQGYVESHFAGVRSNQSKAGEEPAWRTSGAFAAVPAGGA